jgi:hypothetical protein
MLCTFCGTENRPENKFCGMCGVRLERRKVERRVRHDTLKCQACGFANEPGNKFCGMCGTRVDRRVRERRAASPDEPRATAMANAQLPTPDAPGRAAVLSPARAVAEEPKETPPLTANEIATHPKAPAAIFRNESPRSASISGPSFLGLGDEPPNADYLLEDERSSGGVLRRLVLIAIIAAIAGLVFLGWRSGYLAYPKSSSQPARPVASPSPQKESTDSSNATEPAKPDPPPAAAASPSDAEKAAPTAGAASSTATKAASTEDKAGKSDDNSAAAASRKAQPVEDAPSGSRHPSALLLKAQQYLQGKGVRQNCEQGLMYLKAATEKNEPAAAVQMGALYASGHCVQRDQVAAYRWFNSAHELDPANPWIQTNLDQLWAEMTPQQRKEITR